MRTHTTSRRRYVLTALFTLTSLVVAHGGDEDAPPADRTIVIERTAADTPETVRARLRARLRTNPWAHKSQAPLALRAAKAEARLAAVAVVARARGDGVVPLLVERAVRDIDARVRNAATDALRRRDAVRPLLAHTTGGTAQRRLNALAAVERLNDPRAVHVLVARFEAHGGGAPRVHTSVLSQRTFVQDFDVEVA